MKSVDRVWEPTSLEAAKTLSLAAIASRQTREGIDGRSRGVMMKLGERDRGLSKALDGRCACLDRDLNRRTTHEGIYDGVSLPYVSSMRRARRMSVAHDLHLFNYDPRTIVLDPPEYHHSAFVRRRGISANTR